MDAIVKAYKTKPLSYVPAPRMTDKEYEELQQRAKEYQDRLNLDSRTNNDR